MFEAGLIDEKGALEFYMTAARVAADAWGIWTRGLFERTAFDEEGHMT